MKTIWKFPIPITDSFQLSVPRGSRFVHLETTYDGNLNSWWLVDSKEIQLDYISFNIVGTGMSIPDGYDYVATALQAPFVWHLFRKP